MRAALVVIIVVDLICCAWIFLQAPIIKMSASTALINIENQYLGTDPSNEEQQRFESYKDSIIANERSSSHYLSTTKSGVLFLGGLLLIQNYILISILSSKRRKNGLRPLLHTN